MIRVATLAALAAVILAAPAGAQVQTQTTDANRSDSGRKGLEFRASRGWSSGRKGLPAARSAMNCLPPRPPAADWRS